MKVPFLPYNRLFENERGEFLYEFQRVMEEGLYILGSDVEVFEKKLADFIGTRYAVGVNSGTDALFLAMKAAGIGPGDEVITVSHTFVATIQTIDQTGATPVLVDIGEDGLMDMIAVERAITPKTKAIIPVHLEGKSCDLYFLRDLCSAKRLMLIEDAAQALGAVRYWDGQQGLKVGSVGLAGCFSFYPAKIMGVPGDAGAITTNDEKLYHELVGKDGKGGLRNHYGISKGVEGKVKFGYNSRLDNIQAAFLNVRFKNLKDMIKRRAEIAQHYDLGLAHHPIKLAYKQPGRVYQDYVIRLENQKTRDELKAYLDEQGVGTLGTDLVPNHLYDGLNLEKFNLPNTVEYINTQMRLPCNPLMSDEEVVYVIDRIGDFFYGKRSNQNTAHSSS